MMRVCMTDAPQSARQEKPETPNKKKKNFLEI
jgi:hypothetical protein